MSSQRLFDSQVLDMDSALFDSQVDPGVWAGGHTLAAPVGDRLVWECLLRLRCPKAVG